MMTENLITNVFFDLDRTLWDFDRNSHEALVSVFDALNLTSVISKPKAFFSDYKRINDQLWVDYRQGRLMQQELRFQRFHMALKKHGLENPKIAERYNALYMDYCPKIPNLLPNALAVLDYLKERNKSLHIITNGFEAVQKIKLKHAGIEKYFEVVVCSDTAGCSKPDKRIFEIALNQAKTSAQSSLMIGDQIEVDILGANALGMQTLLFDPKKQHKSSKSVKVIHDLIEIEQLIF